MAEMDRALEECLSALHDGRALQDVLRRYPGRRDQLIAMLQLSVDLEQLTPPAPEGAFRLRARNRMLAAAHRGRSLPRLPLTIARRLRPALVGMAGVAAAAGLAVSSVNAAAHTLPGDPLYSVKIAAEGIELRLTIDPLANAHLRLEFAQRRLGEAQALARIGRVPEAVQLIDVYANAISADSLDPASAVDQQVADQQLKQLAGTLTAAGDAQAAVSVERARTHLEHAIASRQAKPAQGRASVAPARPGPATGNKQPY